jgi:DNA-binding response OmpR family regulator
MSTEVVAVIDDNQAWIDTVTEVLTEEGFDVRCATDGESAIDLLDSIQPSLIILDVHIPGSSGLRILADFRGRDRTTPVLVVSGDDRALVRHQAMSDGASAFLQKPVSSSILVRAVRRYLRPGSANRDEPTVSQGEGFCADPSLN